MEQHLSQYKIFYEVARCGNISRAAKELYISQPAISKAISKLEESLGIKLFSRNSRGVQLTREGAILFQHVNTAFDSIGRGERELKRIHDFHIGNLKIGVSNTLCKYVLLPYLKGFIGKYPQAREVPVHPDFHNLEYIENKNKEQRLCCSQHDTLNILLHDILFFRYFTQYYEYLHKI